MSRIPDKVITLVIGSACSGKSTLAGYLGRKGHGVTFRASACLEAYVVKNFPNKKLSDFIGPDFLAHIPDVDDAMLLCQGIVDMTKVEKRMIVDGYPRGLHQVYTLMRRFDDMLAEGHVVRIVDLIVPVPELLRRMYIRNRHTDTEARILAEVEIHKRIASLLRELSEKNNQVSFVEFIVPENADEAKVKRDFTPGLTGKMQEIAFMDSICRRMNDIFSEIEYKRNNHFSKKSSASVHL